LFVARLGLGDADLLQPRRLHANHREFGNVAAEFFEPLDRPRRNGAGQTPPRDVVAFFEFLAEGHRIEQAERALKYRTDFLASLQNIDRLLLHQLLQAFG
jgi:hypothetical protein